MRLLRRIAGALIVLLGSATLGLWWVLRPPSPLSDDFTLRDVTVVEPLRDVLRDY